MTILSGSMVEVNAGSGVYVLRRSYQCDPQERKALDKLHAELRAGRFHRCPKCLTWINRKQHGAVMSHSLRTADTNKAVRFVAFAICKKCFVEHLSDPESPEKLIAKLNAYFGGEYIEAVK